MPVPLLEIHYNDFQPFHRKVKIYVKARNGCHGLQFKIGFRGTLVLEYWNGSRWGTQCILVGKI